LNFSCNRSLLDNALSHAGRAVSSRCSVEILKGTLHLECKDGTLTVTGNDLELGIMAALPVQVRQPGAAVLDAHMITEIAHRTDGDEIALSVDGRRQATVTSGDSEFSFPCLPAEDYPALPSLEGFRTLEMPQAALKRQIAQTLFSVSVSEGKGLYTGALLDVEPGRLTVVALDGHRLALRREAVLSDETYRCVVPGNALRELERMLTPDEEASVTLRVGAKHLLARLPGRTLIARLLEGAFLNYQNAIPQDSAYVYGVDAKSMLGGLDRVGLLISEQIKNPVRLLFSQDRLRLLCQTALGRARDTLPVSGNGAMEIGFNHRYLTEALRRMEAERFRLETAGPNAPCLLLPEGDENALFMVLPVRLTTEGD